MRLPFVKMHGLGNDFVVFDGVRHSVSLNSDEIRALADRHFGVGCDQVLLVERPTRPDAEFRYRIFNADGGEVEQCGNGARCFARFVHDQGLTTHREIPVETRAGRIVLRLEDDGRVTVNMGQPRLDPSEIPFDAPARAATYAIDIDGGPHTISVVSMGNPHAVLRVAEVDRAPVVTLGPLIERHPRFPNRVNVGFMQVVDRAHIRLRVWERGAGETLACGTGACAAVVSGQSTGELNERVLVQLCGGALEIRWGGAGEPVWMTGPASFVCEGTVDPAALALDAAARNNVR